LEERLRFEALLADLSPASSTCRPTSVIFPLAATGRVFGALSFGTLAAEREWPDVLVQRLQLMADIFANALARQQSEQALRQALDDVTRLKQQLEAEKPICARQPRRRRATLWAPRRP
jgi:GAF domain-containing protein